jgi:polyhydroxybutyrate depolymerase
MNYGKFLCQLIGITLLSLSLPQLLKATDINGSLVFEGKTRTYLLHVPSIYNDSNPTPLVLVFHGLTGTGSMMADITQFSPLADQENFIVVYPDGLNKQWTSSSSASINDVGFIGALIDKLSTSYNIDASRTFAAGASNGGMFTYRLGIELTDRFAAIAAVAGYMPGNASQTVPSKPISVLHFHGTGDMIIPYDKATSAFNYWADFDNCSMLPVTITLPNSDLTDGTTVDQTIDANGTNNTEVELYKIYDGGHTWPGTGSHAMPGKVCKDINATSVIWDFFKNNSSIANTAPAVSITKPSTIFTFVAGSSIAIKATASDPGGSIQQVEFLNGNNSLKVDAVFPYSFLWKNVPAGTYDIKATATDNNGAKTTDIITVIVTPLKAAFNISDNAIEALYNQYSQEFVINKADDLSEYDLYIYDEAGRKILLVQNINELKKVIHAELFTTGLYIYTIKMKGENSLRSGKFVVAH